jgi:acyl-CoA synthetase (AMP-forming)/AMP-acid ligase II
LVYPPGLAFISGIFGCLYAGVAAEPAYPPRANRPMTRLRTIVEDARPAVALTCAAIWADSVRWSAGIPGLAGVDVLFSDEEDGEEQAHASVDPEVTDDTLALLQYTSGSTAVSSDRRASVNPTALQRAQCAATRDHS